MQASRISRSRERFTWQWLVALGLLALLSACGGSADEAGAAGSMPTLTSIVVSGPGTSIGVGQTQTLTAEARDQTGAPMSGVQFSWASSNSAVVSVHGGVATGVAAGQANITAMSGGITSNGTGLTVVAAAPKGSVVIDKASVFFSAGGQAAQLAAQVLDVQGAPAAGAGVVSWTSSAPDKVSVDASGRLVANAVGSAQIFAESGGLRSLPTLVFVAVPQAGALLVTDAQVLSVTAPAPAASGSSSTYEVRLQGVTTPPPGTVMLAAESAPIAGKVVATRPEAGAVVVTLALAPLYELFSAYDIGLNIDLSAFALEAVPEPVAATARSAVWVRARDARPRALAMARPLDAFAPFKAWKCDASIKPQLVAAPIQLTLQNTLHLVLEDRSGYSKHALEGSLAIVGNAGLKLQAGFNASGRCDAQGQIKVAAFGWFSVIVMPAVRVGVGAELKGTILLVQGELGVEGKVGLSGVMGWECGGATPSCRALDALTPLRELKTKSQIPDGRGMQAKVSAQFYVIAGLDASILLGAINAGIVEARIGPKQSFDLAFEEDQAARTDYASSYDLKLEGIVEPGPALKEAIKKVINDDATGVKFEANFHVDLSESPKGNLSVSKSRVALGKAVDFTVEFTPTSTLEYFLLGYNVTGIQLYRKRDDEAEFTTWKSMTQTASNQATYHWQTEASDAGKYEFAAFVNTQLLTPLLEIAPNSVKSVEVSCFSAGPMAAASPARARAQAAPNGSKTGPLAASCADTWSGTSSLMLGPTYSARANVVWRVDPTYQGSPTSVRYLAEGSVDVTVLGYPGCSASPTHFVFDATDPFTVASLIVNFDSSPPTYGGGGGTAREITITCGISVFKLNQTYYWFSSSGGTAINDGLVIDVSGDTIPQPGSSFTFTRP